VGKKIAGWILFGVGLVYLSCNLIWTGLEAIGLFNYDPEWSKFPIRLALWLAITALISSIGWGLAHKKVANDLPARS